MKALFAVLLVLVPVLAVDKALSTQYCTAPTYGVPGFQSSRDIFPRNNTLWDNVRKVAFQNADCTWLAGNFMDTGSDFVVVMFGGATTHKETWPLPDLARTLAKVHGFSSLAVDIAGRGESCGYEVGPDHTSEVVDMAAAVHFVNSLPGRYCGGLFGISSGAASSVFYASQVADVPAVFMAEPDDILVLSTFVDHVAGGDVAERLKRAPEIEITAPNKADRLVFTQESMRALQATNLDAVVAQIPSDLHLHWYTAERGSSLESEMRNLSFAHVKDFHHRHFPEARHDFMFDHPEDFLSLATSDMASEAHAQTVAREYMNKHRQPAKYTPCSSSLAQEAHESRHLTQQELRQQRRQAMPKHIYIDDKYRSNATRGLVNPAAVKLQPLGWMMMIMHFDGCFGSDCPLQVERAYNAPLLAQMGVSNLPDPRNISNPRQISFNAESWAAVVEEISAHKIGGLRFTSYRPFVYQNQLHVSYAVEIFDKSLQVTAETPSDEHKMRFQGTGFSRVNLETLELHSVKAFAQPLIPRREFPCCDKNWGVMESGSDLFIFYTLLPCLTIFKLDLAQETGATFVYASCLNDNVGAWVSKAAGLEMRDVRISGHPIMWSQYPQTLLVLVHHNWRKHGGSKHWAVQLQFNPLQQRFVVSAISKDPVLDHEQYFLYNEAVLNVIAVGSYHLAGNRLRVLYGDGDKYSAYADVDTAGISWIQLNSTSATQWTDGLSVALGDRVNSITYTEYESLVW